VGTLKAAQHLLQIFYGGQGKIFSQFQFEAHTKAAGFNLPFGETQEHEGTELSCYSLRRLIFLWRMFFPDLI
jgi:hypothetical protein